MNRRREASTIERLLRIADQLTHRGARIQKLLKAATVTSNPTIQRNIFQAIAAKSAEHHTYPFNEELHLEPVRLGTTPQKNSIGIHPSDLSKHLLAVGQSGMGKTTLFYNLYDQIEQPVWFFDLKQDYRHLAGREELLVLPWSEFRFNPLRPPEGVSPRRWAQVFSEIFGHATALLSGSKNHLLKQVIELYRIYDLFDWVSEPYPSLHELQDLIGAEKINYVRTSSDYRDRLLNRVEAMNLSAGTVFDCSEGYPLAELLQRDVVFEFDGLSRDVQNFLMEILMAWVYEYRLAQNQRGGNLRHLFFLDEGKRVFSVYKERQDASGIPEIDELTAKMREFGEGLIVADQEASKLTDSIKANTYTKLLLPTGGRTQFQAMAKSMNLSERQMEFAQDLDVGEAIVQVGNREPAPVKLDNYRLEKEIADKELEKVQAEKWRQLSYEPRDPIPEFEQKVLHGKHRGDEQDIPDDPDDMLELSQEADRFLEDVIQNPFRPLTDRYQDFSSAYKGNKAKNELIDSGLALERRVRNADGQLKLLQLTEKGRTYAQKHLDVDPQQPGRGGIVHQYWQHRIKEAFEQQDWNAQLEHRNADVYATMGNTELAIEVAMGNNPREIEHVEKHLERMDAVWIVCRNEEVHEGLARRLEENEVQGDRAVFRLFRDFSNEQDLPR